MRAWMFSSVTSRAVPRTPRRASDPSPAIDVVDRQRQRLDAEVGRRAASASSMLPRLENGDGIRTPSTWSAPSASAAMAAVSAESMPPESPSTARAKPHLRA